MFLKKKILFVNGHMRYGGIEKSLLDVLRNLNYDKYEVDLLLIEGKGDYFKEIPTEVHIIFKNLTNAHGPFLESIKQCLKKKDLLAFFARFVFLGSNFINLYFLKFLEIPLLGNKNYDFAIAYRKGICTELVQYMATAKKKSTWWHHGAINLEQTELKRFEKITVLMKNIVFVSESSEKMLVSAMPLIKNFTTIIPNMIDAQNIIAMSNLFDPNFENGKKHFVTSCRFAPEKHLENIIFAGELLIKMGFSNFQWHIIGDGDNLKYLEGLSDERKTTNNVLFEGKKENPFPYLKHADIYIHTSYIESQGLSILEAMTLSIPCIITDNEGIRDYANENNAIIVKQEVQSLVEAIIDLCENKERYDLLKVNTKCPEKFSSKHIMQKINIFLS
jgi:glycosyltransferase involved in cell wall biosynthesis